MSVLIIFDPALPRRVLVDISGIHLEEILEQLVNRNWHSVEYLSNVENCWLATKREILSCTLVLEKWRPYLIGQPFEIITDYASLQFLTSKPKLSRYQTHWLESLADIQLNFILQRSKLHAAPDALSKFLVLNSIGKVSNQQALHEAVLIDQRNSHDWEFLNFRRLANQAISGFALKDGLVIKIIGRCKCIVLPQNSGWSKETVFHELHTLPLRGHIGYYILLALLNAHYWWPHIHQAVQEFCYQCVLCQQTKIVMYKPLGLLSLYEPPFNPFEQVTMDLITHLPVYNGFDAVFTITDRFSKYATFLLCITSSTAIDLAHILYNIIVCKFGMPTKIVSDSDNKFLFKFWRFLMKILYCKVSLFSCYYPLTDRKSEHFY